MEIEFDTSNKAVTAFLDAVDIVLNSNTFLLHYTAEVDCDIKDALTSFVNSNDFYQQFLKQDIDRKWHNHHHFNSKTDRFEPRSTNLVKPGSQLTIGKPAVSKLDYLIAMLTANNQDLPFFSFYSQQIEVAKATQIVNDLIYYITWGSSWELYTIRPDFLYNGTEKDKAKGTICYFDDCGNDAATLIVSGNRHYMILTNGMD